MDLAAQNSAAAQSNMNRSSSGTLNSANMPEGISQDTGGLAYVTGSADSWVNAYNTAKEWKREDDLRAEAHEWDSHELDRIIEAGKRNGINPIFLLDALSGGNSASYATSATKASNVDTNAKTDQANSAKVFGALLAALAMIAAVAL